ncbi:MAG: CRTAC1 family protein [Pseudomonadota bacterium]
MTHLSSPTAHRMSIPLIASCLLAACATAAPRPAALEHSIVLDSGAGLSEHGGVSRGVAWGDFDGDGFPDLAIANTEGGHVFVYRNQRGQTFQRIESGDVWEVTADAQGVVWTDVNNDGWLDLFVTAENGRNLLFVNDGKGGLHDTDGGALTQDVTQSTQSCWADINRDGWLDAYVVNADYQPDRLYINQGDSQFVVTPGPWSRHENHGRSCAFADPNLDGYPDLYVTNAYSEESGSRRVTSNAFYLNGVDGFNGVTSGEVVHFTGYSYGVSWFDADQDGDEDLFVSNISRYEPNWYFENVGDGHFFPNWGIAMMRHRPGPVKGHVWADFDNDGDTDLFLAEGHGGARPEHAPFDNRNSYFENTEGSYAVVDKGALTEDARISAGAAAADVDLDGDLDLVIANWAGDDLNNEFYRNHAAGNWVSIRLQGTSSNRLGVGAQVKLETASDTHRTQYKSLWLNNGYASMSEPVLHFGLEAATQIERLTISWPSGRVDTHEEVDANQHYTAIESDDLVMDTK